MTDTTREDSDEEVRQDDEWFVCPECSEEIIVNAGVRTAILEHGCPVCTASVTETAFK